MHTIQGKFKQTMTDAYSLQTFAALAPLALSVAVIFIITGLVIAFSGRLMHKAKKRSKGAYLLLAVFPLMSLFPIPPQAYQALDKTQREQEKRKEDAGDPPEGNAANQFEHSDDTLSSAEMTPNRQRLQNGMAAHQHDGQQYAPK